MKLINSQVNVAKKYRLTRNCCKSTAALCTPAQWLPDAAGLVLTPRKYRNEVEPIAAGTAAAHGFYC